MFDRNKDNDDESYNKESSRGFLSDSWVKLLLQEEDSMSVASVAPTDIDSETSEDQERMFFSDLFCLRMFLIFLVAGSII